MGSGRIGGWDAGEAAVAAPANPRTATVTRARTWVELAIRAPRLDSLVNCPVRQRASRIERASRVSGGRLSLPPPAYAGGSLPRWLAKREARQARGSHGPTWPV